ncbi:MAG TPA: hypothetical protein VFT74_18580, partial [Isosphaeraceae bacterium]|nr:hypothetical protein [Isosphaeraceae bacterium]
SSEHVRKTGALARPSGTLSRGERGWDSEASTFLGTGARSPIMTVRLAYPDSGVDSTHDQRPWLLRGMEHESQA